MTGLLFAFYAWLASTAGLCPAMGASSASGPSQSLSCGSPMAPPSSTEPQRPDWAPSASNIYNGF